MRHPQRAFTLIELMVALAVLGLVLSFVIGSFSGMLSRQRLQAAAENLYDMMLLARAESISRNGNVYVSVVEGASWCYGMDDTATCACSTSNDCQVNADTKVTTGTDYTGITLDNADIASLCYDARRGLPAATSGSSCSNTAISESSFTFSNANGDQLTVRINPVGRLRLCTDSGFRGYQACS